MRGLEHIFRIQSGPPVSPNPVAKFGQYSRKNVVSFRVWYEMCVLTSFQLVVCELLAGVFYLFRRVSFSSERLLQSPFSTVRLHAHIQTTAERICMKFGTGKYQWGLSIHYSLTLSFCSLLPAYVGVPVISHEQQK